MDDVLISKCRNCINCPYRLYQKQNDIVKQGQGNYFGKAIFIVDDDESVKILKQVYENLTGRDIFEDYYVTTLYKCKYNKDIKRPGIVGMNCIKNVREEINKIQTGVVYAIGTNVISIVSNYLNNKNLVLDTILDINFKYKTFYLVNYNPKWCKKGNIVLKDTFINEFSKIINK